jgi:glycosyltransferase involved in cell wall biosynthesis
MQKISVLTPWLTRSGGGLQSSVRDLVLSLNEIKRYKVETVGIADENINDDICYWKDSVLRIHKFYGPESFRFSPAFIYDVLTMNTDFFQLHGVWMSPSFSLRLRNMFRKDVPILISPHGMLDPWIINRNAWKKNLARSVWENSLWQSANVFRALNLEEAAAIKKLLPNKPVCVIPNGINAVEFGLLQSFQLRRLGKPPVLLYLGRLHEKKCVLELIHAWKLFKAAAKSDWLLEIAGWGDKEYTNAVTTLIKEVNESSISFLGPVFGDQKQKVLGGASAFILPSRSEGLPISVLEACTYGLLPIISKDCNLPELLSDYPAILVGTEPKEIAVALLTLNSKPLSEVSADGELLHKYVSAKYNWTDIAKQFCSVQEWCTYGKTRPAGIFV